MQGAAFDQTILKIIEGHPPKRCGSLLFLEEHLMKKFTVLFTTLFLLCSVSHSLAALEAPVVSSSTE